LDYYEPELVKFNNSLATLLPRKQAGRLPHFCLIFAHSFNPMHQRIFHQLMPHTDTQHSIAFVISIIWSTKQFEGIDWLK